MYDNMSLHKEFKLMTYVVLCVFSVCVFLPGWLIGFGKFQDVTDSLINMA